MEASGTPTPPWTSDRRPQWPRQPNDSDSVVLRRTPDWFSPSSRCGQTEPIHVGSTNVGSAITVQSRHNRGVHRQLCPAMEGQPVRDNVKSATILHVHGLQIQVAHHHVGGHSGAGLMAHPGSSTLERKAPSCQHPCTSTSCTVVAKSVNGTATPAEAPGEGEWEPETAERESAEQLGVKLNQCVRRHSGQRNTSTTTTLRPQKSSLPSARQGRMVLSRKSRSTPLMASISNSSRF